MSSRRAVMASALLLGAVPGAAPSAEAQPTPVRRWADLAGVTRAGMPLRITVQDESGAVSVRRGPLVAIDATTLELGRQGDTERIAAAGITRIERADARSRRVWRVGVPLGALAGGLVTLLIDAQSSNPEPGQAFGMGAVLIGAPLGAVAAAALPVRPLYERPSAGSAPR